MHLLILSPVFHGTQAVPALNGTEAPERFSVNFSLEFLKTMFVNAATLHPVTDSTACANGCTICLVSHAVKIGLLLKG